MAEPTATKSDTVSFSENANNEQPPDIEAGSGPRQEVAEPKLKEVEGSMSDPKKDHEKNNKLVLVCLGLGTLAMMLILIVLGATGQFDSK